MKLRKQTRLKALITALTTGLFLLFLGLIRAQPQISAEANPVATPAPNYDSFFGASGGRPAPAEPTASTQRPHTRTHAS
jgi:hypothetical protein